MPEDVTSPAQPWPNQQPVVDGVVPVDEVSQDPELFDEIDEEDLEMEATP